MLEEKEVSPTERIGSVQSVVRAFRLLDEVVRHEDGVGLAELAKEVGLHNSTAFHLVRTMVEIGYLRRSTETKRYHAGHKLFGAAASALTEIELVGTARPFLEDLARETGESAYLATRSGDEVMIVAVVPGGGAIHLRGRPGTLRPPHATALGKILLAGLPKANLQTLLDRLQLERLTENTTTDKGRLLQELDTIRQAGIAFDDGEFDAEVRCAAVPVYNFLGQVAAGIGISGPAWRLKLQVLSEKAPRLRTIADRLSEAIGGTQRYSQAEDTIQKSTKA